MKEGSENKKNAAGLPGFSLRRYIQLIAAVLYNCNITGFATGATYRGAAKGVCVPGLNCYSCPGAVFACPLGSFQAELRESPVRLPYYMLGTLILFGVLFGRMICGFLCPFGLLQELLNKIPTPKIGKSAVTDALSKLKYIILIVFVIAVPLILRKPGFCQYICPAGTLEGGIPLFIRHEALRSMIGWLFSWKMILLIVCVTLSIFCYRAFCRFFCPLGAVYSLFNPVSFFGVKVDEASCTGCGTCVKSCRMDVHKVGDMECINCGECIRTCPVKAISLGYKGPGQKDHAADSDR